MSDYLWNKSGPVDPEIADLEARLSDLAFDAKVRPFNLKAGDERAERDVGSAAPAQPLVVRRRPRRSWRTPAVVLSAIAASLLLAAGLYGFHVWRLDWTAGAPWSVNGRAAALGVGQSLDVRGADARIDVARLGVMSAAPGTQLELLATGPARHRLSLTHGRIHVRLWAPPGRVTLWTPAGDVVDLGCIFTLSVDDVATRLSVETGWVNLNNFHGNSFIPEGASAQMTAGAEPGVPVYDDAPETFRDAVRKLEATPDISLADTLRTITFEARTRDVLTLLTLADRDNMPPLVRAALLERATVLSPAPAPDAIQRIIAGDRDMFWKWYDSLPLPSLKNWWRNWRDVFPR